MKKIYESPKAYVELFTPNEYVAACGDSGKTYKFTCDAGGGKIGSVYLETNGIDGLQKNNGWGYEADTYLSNYHACGTTHNASSEDAFLKGYYVTKSGGWGGGTKTTPVIVWRGPDNDNTHCTTNLDISSWETAKS